MGSAPNPQVVAQASNGLLLRARFIRDRDRWAHRIEVVDQQGRVTRVLDSQEGDSGEAWPPSPPLQQLTIQRHGSQAAAMLLGMAGSSHWSASIEPAINEPRLSFDLACRVQQQPAATDVLGSTYWAASQLQELLDAQVILAAEKHRVTICLQPCGESNAARIRWSQGRLQILATHAPAIWPATLRWQYAVMLS